MKQIPPIVTPRAVAAWKRVFVIGLGVASLLCAATLGRASEPAAQLLTEFREDPMRFFFEQRTEEAILCSQHMLQGADFAPNERRQALTALAAIYTSTGRQRQARAAFMEYLSADPTAELESPEFLPPPVVKAFYSVRDSLLMTSELSGAPDIRTIAVGDIENNSIMSGKYDLDRFVRGLSHVLVTDLKSATPMKVVDRMRLRVLLDEIGLNDQAQIVDARYAVPFGKLSGAQSYIFGSLIMIDDDRVRLDLRWVDTSTTEILLAEGIEMKLGSPKDLLDLEKKVLLDHLLPRMASHLEGAGEPVEKKAMEKRMEQHLKERQSRTKTSQSDYAQLLLETGAALLAEEEGDFVAAESAWRRVHAIDTEDSIAGHRADALQAYVDLGNTQ